LPVNAPFEVLGEPHRRRILELLGSSERPAGDLVQELEITQPAVSKHLRILRQAGLVDVRTDAQRRLYRVRSEPLRAMYEWLDSLRVEPGADRLGRRGSGGDGGVGVPRP
jgi:DNA-binding transcriptional ArsR family regulator